MAQQALSVPDPGQPGPYAVGFSNFVVVDPARDNRRLAMYVWYPSDHDVASQFPPADVALDPITGFFDGGFHPLAWVLENILGWDLDREVCLDGGAPCPLPEAGVSDVPGVSMVEVDGVLGLTCAMSSACWEEFGLEAAYHEPPPADGRFPLLLVSHGSLGLGYYHIYTGTRLAQHGVVVAAVTHTGNALVDYAVTEDPEIVTRANRPLDLSFALDVLTAGDYLPNIIDEEHVFALGHSYGGYTVGALVAGVDRDGINVSPDDRITGIIELDSGLAFFTAEELAQIAVPTSLIGTECNASRARVHGLIGAHVNYRVDISNTRHTPGYNNRCEAYDAYVAFGFLDSHIYEDAPDCLNADLLEWSEVHRLVNQYTIAFLKTLVGEPGYRQLLTPGWDEDHIEFFVTEPGDPQSYENTGQLPWFCNEPGGGEEPILIHPPPALVCHNDADLLVPRAALAAHRAHGDTSGCGFIGDWLVLGPYDSPGGAPAEEVMREDYLAYGTTMEENIVPAEGDELGERTITLEHVTDTTLELHEIFCNVPTRPCPDAERPSDAMSYLFTYVDNLTGARIPVDFAYASDDGIQILLRSLQPVAPELCDGSLTDEGLCEVEVDLLSVNRGAGVDGEIQNRAPEPPDQIFLQEGRSLITVKLFQGDGRWRTRLRLEETGTETALISGRGEILYTTSPH